MKFGDNYYSYIKRMFVYLKFFEKDKNRKKMKKNEIDV